MSRLSFLGLRTPAFDQMRHLYADVLGLRLLRDDAEAAWFVLDDGTELHVYPDTDGYHAFFGTAPVPGLWVEDFDAAVDRLSAAGVEWQTETSSAAGRRWRHYRAPDQNVYEVMGPEVPDAQVR